MRATGRLAAALLFGLVAVGTVQGREPAAVPFDAWVEAIRKDALARGISARTLTKALDGIEPVPRVIELDRNQPESKLSLAGYLERVINDERVRRGKTRMRRHAELLGRIRDRYGVQPRFLVALWGIESDFGRRTGGFSVIQALATLAWDGRRADFFRRELLDALQILDEGHVKPAKMKGSWAGAMGQPQFMPSTFRGSAVDFDGDSRRDIWGTIDDALASAANLLSKSGWKVDQTWGRKVRLPAGFDADLFGLDTVRPMSAWRELGVRRADGSALPQRELDGSIVRPGGASGPAYLVYGNYRTLLKWNRSLYFATAVGILSDQLR